jgi:hypothetical protein
MLRRSDLPSSLFRSTFLGFLALSILNIFPQCAENGASAKELSEGAVPGSSVPGASVSGNGVAGGSVSGSSTSAVKPTAKSDKFAIDVDKLKIHQIYFFGNEGLDLQKIKANLPIRADEEITPSDIPAFKQRVSDYVEKLTGKPISDLGLVLFEQSWTVYLGLPGKTNHTIVHNPIPTETTHLSQDIVKLYDETMQANIVALQTAKAEDRAKFDKLMSQGKDLCRSHREELVHVVSKSSDPEQRRAAAHCLGLIAETQPEIAALSRASNDSDATVRNNAVRALGFIIKTDAARFISASEFIELLNSGVWTDRNKGSFMVASLVKNRDAKLLAEVKAQALASLKEMATWDLAHASPALEILGVLADIPEDKLARLIASDKRQEILDALK